MNLSEESQRKWERSCTFFNPNLTEGFDDSRGKSVMYGLVHVGMQVLVPGDFDMSEQLLGMKEQNIQHSMTDPHRRR